MREDRTFVFIALAVAAALLAGGGAVVYSGAKGLRNNNPGNIRLSADRWQGLASPQTDPEFFQFESPLWGIRALARTLKTYIERHGIRTVAGIISRWAPPIENDTAAYIAAVSARTNLDPNERVDYARDVGALVHAIITQENGFNPYPADLLRQGISLA